MASNFFEQQDTARKKSGQLVGLFAAAVLGVTLAIYGVVLLALISIQQPAGPGQPAEPIPYAGAFIGTLFLVLVVVGGCSLYKIMALKQGGGDSVAMTLGGRIIHPSTTEFSERKVMNVVEEMALASGTPVPPVYLLEHESGINAFAAGYSPDNAVIGVTRGAIEQLTRDELQGVIAHEFSHILNGDMRLNIRLIGVIFGLIAITVIGRVMLRAAWFTGGGRGKKDARVAIAITLGGLALLIIGAVGVLFGRLIQAAVSRQREYLADASAVQFTRNPDTIGGALKRIGGYGSKVEDGHSAEVSHMFIASSATSWGFGPFATHPPIEKRIKQIDPSWNGEYITGERRFDAPKSEGKRSVTEKLDPIPAVGDAAGAATGGGVDLPGAIIGAAVIADAAGGGQQGGAGAAPPAQTAMDSVGNVSANHVAYMQELLSKIPDIFKEAAHHPEGCRSVIYVLLLDKDPGVRKTQFDHLAQHADHKALELTQKLTESFDELAKEARMPLIDLAVPALREMDHGEYDAFKKNVHALIKADGRVDLFEWSLERLLLRHLDVHFSPEPDPKVHYYSLKPLVMPCGTLLSVLAHVGQRESGEAQQAFEAGAGELGLDGLELLGRKEVKLKQVGEALDELLRVSPREKKKLIAACAKTIAADGAVTRNEGELMRAIADALGVPMPPLLPGQRLI